MITGEYRSLHDISQKLVGVFYDILYEVYKLNKNGQYERHEEKLY